jgi:hypothetical protein
MSETLQMAAVYGIQVGGQSLARALRRQVRPLIANLTRSDITAD